MPPSASPETDEPARAIVAGSEAVRKAGGGSAGVGAQHPLAQEPILCQHCGRTASNGISCIGACVADSGY